MILQLLSVFLIVSVKIAFGESNATKDALILMPQLKKLTASSLKLSKSSFKSESRILFIAGLEGTGHHAMQAMIKHCVDSNLGCEPANELSQIFMTYDAEDRSMHGLFSAADGRISISYALKAESEMKRLADVPGKHLYVVGLGFDEKAGMMSYPNFSSRNKALDHPDIYAMAQIAELVGIDFRVLVLQRPASEIIAAVTNKGKQDEKILIDNAAALHAQLDLLDHKFYMCLKYKELSSLSAPQRKALGDFMHPDIVLPAVDKMLEKVVYTAKNSTVVEKKPLISAKRIRDVLASPDDYHSFQLATRLSKINELCKK